MAISYSQKKVPEIVPIVLMELVRRRNRHELDDKAFNAKILRLANEELEPRNLTLLIRELPNGDTRFIVKSKANNRVCELLELDTDGSRRAAA